MIENDAQFQLTFEQLGRMYKVLAHFRTTILPINPRQYALFAEGPLDEIAKLQADINAYLGLNSGIATPGSVPDNAPALRETPPPFGERQQG
jgi:hypothetical protein